MTTKPCQIRCSESAATAIRPAFPRKLLGLQECFAVLCLDAKHATIGRPEIVAMGTVSNVTVCPRDVFRTAIRKNATAIIVAHNHPSGNTCPSADDQALTKRLIEGAKLLGLAVLDHLIMVPDGTFLSLADKGLLN
jgi:DNA repair protein RadC